MSSERGFKSLIRRAGELLVPTGRACRRRRARRAGVPSALRSATGNFALPRGRTENGRRAHMDSVELCLPEPLSLHYEEE